jgi:hypothetical protein
MPRVTGENLKEAITANVHPKARMMTDEFSAYRVVAEQTGREHHSVKHSRVEFVRGDVHSNMAEGFFSLLKRGINGTFHRVSRAT